MPLGGWYLVRPLQIQQLPLQLPDSVLCKLACVRSCPCSPDSPRRMSTRCALNPASAPTKVLQKMPDMHQLRASWESRQEALLALPEPEIFPCNWCRSDIFCNTFQLSTMRVSLVIKLVSC